MKTALCFAGTGRSIEHTIENLKHTLIDVHPKCDIFIHLAVTPHLKKARKYLDLIDITDLVVEEDRKFDLEGLRWRAGWPAGPWSGDTPKQAVLNALYARQKCGNLLHDYSKKHNIKYDQVIFSRLDVEYFNPLPLAWDLDCICVPDFHNTFGCLPGCNERFAVSKFDNMLTYLDQPSSIAPFMESGGRLHAETLLRWHLENHNIPIKRYKVRFGRVRPDNSRPDERLRDDLLAAKDQ